MQFLLIPNPVAARNGWVMDSCFPNGTCNYSKVISKSWPYVIYKLHGATGNMFTKEADCQHWRTRYFLPNGSKTVWKDVMPGSHGESTLENVCR
jgi:hypothetical protein